ncbi:MAG: CinA family protein [Flavobacteriaceae bacterium]
MSIDREWDSLVAQASGLLDLCRARRLMVVTAESCTGGLVAGVLTEVAGSSDVVERGFVTYSNEAKQELLGVSAQTLEAHGAVSEQTAREMAAGALAASRADISVSITGVAGPGGGSPEKPVGLVHFAAARGNAIIHRRVEFPNNGRRGIRLAAVHIALNMLREMVN